MSGPVQNFTLGSSRQLVSMLGNSTGLAGADGHVLNTHAGEWLSRSVTQVGALPPSRDQTMPSSDSAATDLMQFLNGASAGELIPELVRQCLQALIEAEAAAAIDADHDLRTAQRRVNRKGSCDHFLATPAGDVQLRIPHFRMDSFLPALLEPRRRVFYELSKAMLDNSSNQLLDHQQLH